MACRYINRQIAIGRQADLRRPVAVADVNEAMIVLTADNDNKPQ
ncbi:hypothetical protein X737_30150 [Mesorhizobium sp. L48C026A00]|nr:hypothetical protein X737_30150 [Mesorhizobium sp. L48C026A00]